MPRLALYLLGPPRIELNGEGVHIARRKAVALLAYLVVEGRAHSRDTLATLFWPQHDQSSARAGLRRTLSVLSRMLGAEWLTIDREAAGPNPDAEIWLDVVAFSQRLAACEAHGQSPMEVCPDCLPLLEEALRLYKGDFLEGFTLSDSLAFDEWQFFRSEGLKGQLAGALQRLIAWHCEQGEVERAIDYARRWLAIDTAHEPAQRQLMLLYARSGQRSEVSARRL